MKTILNKYKQTLLPPYNKGDIPAIGLSVLVLIGLLVTVVALRQDTNTRSNAQSVNSVEPENGTLAVNVTIVNDTAASGGKYVQFGTAIPTVTPPLSACGSTMPLGGVSTHIHAMNLAWIDGQYDHDLGINSLHPSWGTSYNSTRTAALFADIHKMNANVVRLWLFEGLEGLTFDTSGNVSGIDSTFLTNLDDVVRLAEQNHLYLYLSFINSLGSTKPTIVTDTTAKNDYLNNAVGPLVNRYKGKPIIFAYEVGNELQESIGTAGITWTNLRSFMADTATKVHTVDPGRLISSSISWSDIKAGQASGLGFDFYDFHVYQDTWNPSETGTQGFCSELNADKPVIIGEYGQASSAVDDNLQNSVVNAYQTNAKSHNFAGTFYWAYGGAGDNTYHSITRGDGTWRPAATIFQSFTY